MRAMCCVVPEKIQHCLKQYLCLGLARSIIPEKFLDQLVIQFSLPERCKEAEIDVKKYFCDFIVGSQYHGVKLYHVANSIFIV